MRAHLVVAVMLVTGCSVDLQVPTDAVVRCAANIDCPSAYQCRTALGRCVPNGAETQAPKLVTGSASVVPAVATRGTVVRVTIEASEPLSAAPVVRLTASRTVDLALESTTGLRYVYSLLIAGDEGPGTWNLSASLVDLVGNVATLFVGTLTLDFAAPELVGSLTATPEVTGGAGTVQVSFAVSEALGAAPEASALWASAGLNRPLVAKTDTAPSYTFTYTAKGDEPADPASIRLTLRDSAGNQRIVDVPAVFEVDRQAPSVVPGTQLLRLFPGAGNPLRDITAVTGGTRVEVSFTVSEPLGAEPTLTTEGGGAAFTRSSAVGNNYVFTWTGAGSLADGFHRLVVGLVDVFGNAGSATVRTADDAADLGFTIDVTAPSRPALDAIVYHRAPWGRADVGPAPRFWLTATSGAIEAGSLLIAYDAADVSTAARIGEGRADAGGGFASVDLNPTDRAVVYLTAVDAAGNSSDDDSFSTGVQATPVSRVEWTATLSRKVAGQTFANPHRLQARSLFTPSLNQPDERELGDADGLGQRDGASARTGGAATWRRIRTEPDALGASANFAMAFDAPRNQLLLFGDDPRFCFPPSGRFLQIDHAPPWSTRTVADGVQPAARSGGTMVFDARRERAVLFGGQGDGGSLGDTWEWTGSRWEQRCTTSSCAAAAPSARTGHALAYDEVRGVAVLFGGSTGGDETWEWDGTSWAQRCAAAPCSATRPVARQKHAMAYDRNLGEVVLYGGNAGSSELWSWNGSRWLQRCTTTPCSAATPGNRIGPAMAFDGSQGSLVLFGGLPTAAFDPCTGTAPADTWLFDGTQWQVLSPAGGPTGRSDARLAYHAGRRRLIMAGGNLPHCGGVLCGFHPGSNETWEWDGTRWALLAPFTTPAASSTHVMAFDPVRRRVFACGGSLGQGWDWNGEGWVTSAPTSTRSYATMTRYASSVLFVGGEDSGTTVYDDSWLLNGAGWTGAGATGAGVVNGQGAASDGTGVVVFGGSTTAAPLFAAGVDVTRRWNGSSWSSLCSGTCSRPTARYRQAMAQTGTAGEVLLFGGIAASAVSSETWRWGGAAWQPVTSTLVPLKRYDGAMVYDPQRGVVVMTGGTDILGFAVGEVPSFELSRTWQWAGGQWTEVPLADVEGDGNPPVITQGQFAFDDDRGTAVLFGGTATFADGSQGAGGGAGTWLADLGGGDRAGHHLTVAWGAAGVGGAETLEAVEVHWTGAGAGSSPAGAPQAGVELRLWDVDRWRLLAGTTASGTTQWSTRTDPAWSASTSAQLRRLFHGGGLDLDVGLLPATANGRSPTYGWVETDFVEAIVEYRR